MSASVQPWQSGTELNFQYVEHNTWVRPWGLCPGRGVGKQENPGNCSQTEAVPAGGGGKFRAKIRQEKSGEVPWALLVER